MSFGAFSRPWAMIALAFLCLAGQASAEPVIHRIEPLNLTIGQTTLVTVFGDRLTQDGREPILWSNAPITWTVAEPEDPKQSKDNSRERRFSVTVTDQASAGVCAIRLANRDGISAPAMLLLDTEPTTKSLRLENNRPCIQTFTAKQGQTFYCEAWSRRLNQDTDLIMSVKNEAGTTVASADDDEVIGFDPQLSFRAPATGTYTVEVHDNQWRGGGQCCVRVSSNPLITSDPTAAEFITQQTASPIPLELESDQYLTVTPQTRAIGSSAMLLMELHNTAGQRVAQTGTGDTSDEPLRFKVTQAGQYQLHAYDLVERVGLPFDLNISTDQAPFVVQLDGGSKDRHVIKPEDEFKVRFRVTRFRYDGPITITCPELTLKDNIIPEKRNDIEAKLQPRSPASANPLLTFQFQATATLDGKTYTTPVRTPQQLKRVSKGITQWPPGLDGTCFAFIKQEGAKK